MNTGTKVAVAGAGVLTLFGIWFLNKKKDFEKVITEMTMNISNIRRLKLSSALQVILYCDVTFKNNTNVTFDVNTGGLIMIKSITLFYKGKKLGVARSNTTQFALAANSEFKITNVEVQLVSLNILNQLFNESLDADPANYKIELEIVALGKTYIVEQ